MEGALAADGELGARIIVGWSHRKRGTDSGA